MSRIKESTRKRLQLQGYRNIPDSLLNKYKYGIRFAYIGCGSLVLAGLITQEVMFWYVAMFIAFAAVILPRHPFDYLYNNGIRQLINKPRIPLRTNENRFACGIATFWLALVIALFTTGAVMVANILVGLLIVQAFVVGTIDYCVPSIMYKAMFLRKPDHSNTIRS